MSISRHLKAHISRLARPLFKSPQRRDRAQTYVRATYQFAAITKLISQVLRSPFVSWRYHNHNYRRSALDIPFTPNIVECEQQKIGIALLGTCQVAALVKTGLSFGHNIKHILLESGLTSHVPSFEMSGLDAIVYSPVLRHVLADDMILARLDTNERAVTLAKQAIELITRQLTELSVSSSGLPIFVTSFLEPSFNYRGNLLSSYDATSPRQFLRKLNQDVAEIVSSIKNCYIIDFNEIISWVGRMHLQDDALVGSLHASFIDEGFLTDDGMFDRERIVPAIGNSSIFQYKRYRRAFAEVFWSLISDNLEILAQRNPIKLIVVDLDDTLWRGVAAEDSLEYWERIEGWPLGFVESLLFFKARGGLLAICSKNDREPTLRKLGEIWRDSIREGDFVSVKINWNSKADNVEQISQETNILTQNILFIDDNPRELDEVQSRFPDIRVLRGRHFDWRRIVLRSPQTQVAAITGESLRRTDLVRAILERETSSSGLSREEWLISLKLRQRIDAVKSLGSSDGKRAFELLNKTNQFNTTAKRWSSLEFQKFLNDGVCLVSRLADKNIDNGIISVALIKGGEIVQVVLSCRVFGLGAELAMGSVATRVALHQATTAVGRIVDSGKNHSCHKFFEEIGYKRNGENFETTTPCSIPLWIVLTDTVNFETLEGRQIPEAGGQQ